MQHQNTITITTTQAQNNFSYPLKMVEKGYTVEFTKYGKVIATMKPPKQDEVGKMRRPTEKKFPGGIKSIIGDFKLDLPEGYSSFAEYYRKLRDEDR